MKKYYFIFSFVLLLAFVFIAVKRNQRISAEVNLVNCSIFDAAGKLQKKYLGWVCAFLPNGKMFLGDGFTLNFYDKDMNIVWSKDMHTHHTITYSAADKTALVMASSILNGDTRLDRLEVYDIEGKLLKLFQFDEQHSAAKTPFAWDAFVFPSTVKWEMMHLQSFYRINKNNSPLPALAEGNYVVTDASGKIYFLNSALTKIIYTFSASDWKKNDLNDLQITAQGTFLFYNSGNFLNGKRFTSLEELDPISGKTVWQFSGDPPGSFYSAYEGNVQLLNNGNILYSVILDEFRNEERKKNPKNENEPWMAIQGRHRSYEITRDGKLVWSMITDGKDLSGMPNVIKRQDLSAYVKNKGHY